jgi:hypothetical protein
MVGPSPSRPDRPVTRQDPVSHIEAGPCRFSLPLTGLRAYNVSPMERSHAALINSDDGLTEAVPAGRGVTL